MSSGSGTVGYPERLGVGSNTVNSFTGSGAGKVGTGGIAANTISQSSSASGQVYVSGTAAVTVSTVSTSVGNIVILGVGANSFNLSSLAVGIDPYRDHKATGAGPVMAVKEAP